MAAIYKFKGASTNEIFLWDFYVYTCEYSVLLRALKMMIYKKVGLSKKGLKQAFVGISYVKKAGKMAKKCEFLGKKSV